MIVQFSQIDGDAHFWSFDKFSENKAVLTGRIKYLLIVLFSVFVNSVSGQITQPTAWTKPYDQTTLTATGTSFAIAAGSNRILVVGVTTTYTEGGGSGIQADPTITYGGVSLTKATGNGGTNGRMHTWLYYLKDNTVMDATSRAFNVTGGAVTNATLANMTVWYGVFAGVDQSPASYTTGNGFSNTGANGPATLSAAMTVNTNEQAVYITSIYNDNSAAIPSYTINTNWTSGGTNSGNVNSGGNVAWKNEVAKRSIPGSNTTDQAATSTITPNNNIRFAMSAISFPRVTTPTITSLGSASACEGGSITINGTNLSGVTAANVKIGGTAVSSITSNSATQIVAVVGSGTTGTVTVTTTGGTATSAATFTVNPSPTTSNAGIDQYGTSASFTLAANTPTSGTGAWTITSGPSTSLAQFSSTSSPTATFTPSGSGSYVLTWTITNSCGSSTDDVIIANCVGNLIINGDFAAQTANWTAATTRGTTAETNVENTYFSSGNNDYTAELDYEASLRQVVSVIPGVSYTVTFLYARRENASTPATTDVTVKITGGTSVITSPSLTTTNSTPKVGTLTFTATSSSIGVEFYNTLNTAGQTLGTIIDNIVLVPSSQVTPVATTVPKGIYKTLTSCAGLSVQLDVENVPASGVTYAWTGNAGTVFSSTTIKNPTVTFSGTGILQATVTVTTASGCSGIPSTTYVNFIANPTITTAATPAVVTAVCQSASVQTTTMAYTAATDSPTSYSIDWATLTDQGSTSFAFASGGGNVTGISVPAGTASGTYLGTMTITNANGCIGTKAITLTVNQSPTITTQPSSSAICPGTNKVFSVTTAGAGTLTYAWQISTNGGTTFTALTNGGIYSNVTTASMTLTAPAGTLANNQYRCVVSGGTCTPTSVTSNAGVLTFNASPAGLSYTSATVSYCLNTAIATNSATLTTAGSPAVTYSATLPAGLSIDTATGAITGTPTAVSAAANYTVTATNTCGFTTRVLNITVNSLPVISTQPQALAVCENGSGAFTISTSASSPSYFWEYSADGLTNWLTTNGVAGVTGYNTASLNLSNTPLGYSGNYVRCTITSGSCSIISNTARLTVNPLPAAAGAITGTGTVCQGQSGVTYSVTAITNATGYTWTLPTGASITSGSNTNSITVSYSASAASGTVTVQGTNTCGNGTVSSGFSITVNPLPAAAGAITGSGTVCQGQTGVTYSVPAIANATGYTWTLPTGASITSGTNTRSITVSYSASAASGTVTVQGTNGCGSGTVSSGLSITVNPLPAAAGSITGTGTVCQGQTGVTYSVPTIANATGYTWTLPTGASITSGTNTSSITVSYSASAASGTVTVQGTNGCGSGTVSSGLSITVNPLPDAAGTITGTGTVCQGQTGVTYSVPTIANATGYTWTLPTGASITSGTNTRSITVSYSASAASGTITVQGTNGCGNGTVSSGLSITVNPLPAAAGSITGTGTVCQGQTGVTYSVPTIANATGYTWTLPTGASITSGTNTRSITVSYSASAASGTVTVQGTNGCGSGTVSSGLSITVNPLPGAAGTITGTGTVCQGQTGVTYSVPAITNATGYTWTLPTGASITSGSNTNSITVSYSASAASGTITVQGTNGCGSGTVSSGLSITVNPLPAAAGTITGTGTVCQGQTGVIYSVPAIANATGYTWSLPTGASITSGSNTNSITVSYSASAASGTVTVQGTNGCGSGTVSGNYSVIVNTLPTAPSALPTKQPTCADNTGTIEFTSLGAGFTYSVDGSTFSSSTTFASLAAGIYYIKVKNSSGCESATTPITINASATKVWNGSTNTDWNTAANWTPSGVPTVSDCVEIADVANKPIISPANGSYYAHTLTVDTNGSLIVGATNTLNVTNAVTVSGTGSLIFENQSSLLQTNTSPTINTGNITYKRDISVRRLDLTYWSSPITATPGFTMHDLSPNTLLDKYYTWVQATGWTVNLNGTLVMTQGKGYSIRAPQPYDTATPATYTGAFIGVPNNGNISYTPEAASWNLVGNPYPSALNAAKLMNANANLGSLYFWTHNSSPTALPGETLYKYASADFAVYNLTGSTASSTGGSVPSGFIGAGQAFFVKVTTGDPINFTNTMREVGNNQQFYKTTESSDTDVKSRVWLNFTNAEGAYKQVIIGYLNGATNYWDMNYDAATMNGNSYVDFYSINDSRKLTIQGRAMPFDNTETLPLGYKTTVAGDFTVAIDHVDGLFTDQAVYLEDKVTGKITDLSASNYTFTSEIGTFAERLVLRYTNKTLGTGDFDDLESTILVSVKDKAIKVTSSKETIKEVTVFDISGKLLYNKKKVEATELQLSNLQSSNQVLLVKVTLDNDFTTTKKIIFQ